MVEHRYSQRIKSDSRVVIYERGMPVATGRVLNSSRYGFFVETNHPVARNYPLEIELLDRQRRATGKSTHGSRMKCFVVHTRGNGFGVEVNEDHLNEFSAIAAMRASAGQLEMASAAILSGGQTHLLSSEQTSFSSGKTNFGSGGQADLSTGQTKLSTGQ